MVSLATCLETTPHNTPPNCGHTGLPQLGNTPEQLSTQKQSGEEVHYSKQSGGLRECAGNDTECYSVFTGHEALSHC